MRAEKIPIRQQVGGWGTIVRMFDSKKELDIDI
jgi:hypothetical protein